MRLLLYTHVSLWAVSDLPLLTLPARRLIEAAGVVPLADHHRDAFDRPLFAEAIAAPLRLLTADEVLQNSSGLVILI